MEQLPRALEVLILSGNIDDKIAKQIVQIKGMGTVLAAEWKKAHLEQTEKAQDEIEGLKIQAGCINHSIGGLNKEVERLNGEISRLEAEKAEVENTLRELTAKSDSAKGEAKLILEAELKRLAQSPASMALLGAWMVGGSTSTDRSQPVIRVESANPTVSQAVDIRSALFNNLKSCSLSPRVATELTAVCRAALGAGQPIGFRSLFGDILAGAVASALGQPAVVWADTPAGLLDPVDWDGLIGIEQRCRPLILQNANRSDIQLVLGSLRRVLLEQALGNHKPDGVVLMTLESNAQMRLASEYFIGPVIEEQFLQFNPGRAVSGLSAFSEFAKQMLEVAAVTEDEFAEIGDNLLRLPIFALSAHQAIFRRGYGAIRATCENPNDAARLFFKYWCLPRCSADEVKTTLEAHKDSWAQDKALMKLGEELAQND